MSTTATVGHLSERENAAQAILDRAGFDANGQEAHAILDIFLMGQASRRIWKAAIGASEDLYRLRVKATHRVAPLLQEGVKRAPIEEEFVAILAEFEHLQHRLGRITHLNGLAVSARDKRIDGPRLMAIHEGLAHGWSPRQVAALLCRKGAEGFCGDLDSSIRSLEELARRYIPVIYKNYWPEVAEWFSGGKGPCPYKST